MTDSIAPASGEAFSVVVVDDAPANLMLLAGLLEDAGYDVRVANSGQRGLALIEREAPDVVLLDVNLPDRDGFAICRELRANPALEAMAVVFLSAADDPESRAKAREAGGAEYLVKPFEASEVLDRVRLHARLSRALKENARLRAELASLRARV